MTKLDPSVEYFLEKHKGKTSADWEAWNAKREKNHRRVCLWFVIVGFLVAIAVTFESMFKFFPWFGG